MSATNTVITPFAYPRKVLWTALHSQEDSGKLAKTGRGETAK